MTDAELGQGMRLITEEAKKLGLTGNVVVTLSFQDGGLTKANKQITGPLLPGRRPPPPLPSNTDRPGTNFG